MYCHLFHKHSINGGDDLVIRSIVLRVGWVASWVGSQAKTHATSQPLRPDRVAGACHLTDRWDVEQTLGTNIGCHILDGRPTIRPSALFSLSFCLAFVFASPSRSTIRLISTSDWIQYSISSASTPSEARWSPNDPDRRHVVIHTLHV
jgi:hypothetical protein